VLGPAQGDGWIGTRELPGYRAGRVIAKLENLPGVDAQHFYFDLLLLDARGRTQDTHSGACRAMTHEHTLDDRSRFVRVVAELLRHAPDAARGLAPLDAALSFIREHGIGAARLRVAAQLLDAAASDNAVVASLADMLALSLGPDEAHDVLCDVLRDLAAARGLHDEVERINAGGLVEQVCFVVHAIGKAQARGYLRKVTDFELLPSAEMLGQ
jgi:hypothetical protein